MAPSSSTTASSAGGAGTPPAFSRTRWSLVADLHQPDDERVGRSLRELCERYAFAVYAYARRSGHGPEAANDLCLSFFAQLPEAVAGQDLRSQGRFRDFLLLRLNRFLASDRPQVSSEAIRQRLSAPLPVATFEQRLQRHGEGTTTPTQAYHRSFALDVIEHAMQRLQSEVLQVGRQEMFEVLQPYLAVEPGPGAHAELARQLSMSPLSVAVAIRRLRERFRELADDELAQTVSSREELDHERSAMAELLAGLPP